MAQFGKSTTHVRLSTEIVDRVRLIVEKAKAGTMGEWFEKAANEKIARDTPKKKKA